MSNSDNIEIDWIDKQFEFLTGRIGIFKLSDPEFFFEPTPGFYGFISQGKTEVLNEAIKILADFIGLSTAPIIEPWKNSDNPLTSSDYDFTSDKSAPGFIRYNGPFHSRIELNITNKHSPFVMGAILAHELTHYFLETKNIRLPDTEENERMTDLATAYLGLGKLTLNGYYPVSWEVFRKNKRIEYTYRVGYLNQYDMALIHFKTARFRSINLGQLMLNLTDNSCSEVRKAVSELYVYDEEAFNLGNKFCYKCGKNTRFEYNESDKKLYCSGCGWEYNSAMRISAESPKSFFSKIQELFVSRKK
jgi:ribosomal protein S27AE